MSKQYKFKIEGEDYSLELRQMKQLFKEKYVKLIVRVTKQGGELDLSINSIKDELL